MAYTRFAKGSQQDIVFARLSIDVPTDLKDRLDKILTWGYRNDVVVHLIAQFVDAVEPVLERLNPVELYRFKRLMAASLDSGDLKLKLDMPTIETPEPKPVTLKKRGGSSSGKSKKSNPNKV